MAQLFWAHALRVRDGQAAQRLGAELDVVPLNVPHHQDLGLGLQQQPLWLCALLCSSPQRPPIQVVYEHRHCSGLHMLYMGPR